MSELKDIEAKILEIAGLLSEDMPSEEEYVQPGEGDVRVSKEECEYTDVTEGESKCSNCEYAYAQVLGDTHICLKIDGYVEPEGWCNLYEAGMEETSDEELEECT